MPSTVIKTKHGNFYLESKDKKILREAPRYLRQYFAGRRSSEFKKALSEYTKSERRVLKELAKIKKGQVVTYQELARKAGFPRGARFVGNVMRKNRLPFLLPCHRVIASGGGLGGYSLGLKLKKQLLELEGAKIVAA